MKHTEITKKKISETLKRMGIKPTVLPSRKQCIENLSGYIGKSPWNKGKTGLSPSWNKGLVGYMSGSKNGNWKGGKPKCIDCAEVLKNRNAKMCVTCSHKARRGEGHYNWKGGTTVIKAKRTSAEYKHWRMSVYRRDWFTCQMPKCGYKGKDLEAHHIVPVKDNESLIFEVSNGITLCKKCHLTIRNREEKFVDTFAKIFSTTAPKGLVVTLGFGV